MSSNIRKDVIIVMDPEIRLLCSTGTMVRRDNSYNYPRAVNIIDKLCEEGTIYGGELMMLVHYYDKMDKVTSCVADSAVPFPVIHCEKGVGSDLSRSATLYSEGNFLEAEALFEDLVSTFRLNCEFGRRIGAAHMVFHLWSGMDSDRHIEYNCEKAPLLKKIASEYGLRLLFETIPGTTRDPLTNLLRLTETLPDAEFIYDTRLSALHGQECTILQNADFTSRLRHVHISDFRGKLRDFSALRPIYHPGEGQIDFEAVADKLKKISYNGKITLESPVTCDDDRDIEKLRRTFGYIARVF